MKASALLARLFPSAEERAARVLLRKVPRLHTETFPETHHHLRLRLGRDEGTRAIEALQLLSVRVAQAMLYDFGAGKGPRIGRAAHAEMQAWLAGHTKRGLAGFPHAELLSDKAVERFGACCAHVLDLMDEQCAGFTRERIEHVVARVEAQWAQARSAAGPAPMSEPNT